MAEYIERDKAIEKINAYCELRQAICINDKDEFLRGLQTALKAISYNDVIPNADVQPVKQWVKLHDKHPDTEGFYLVCDQYGECEVVEYLPDIKSWFTHKIKGEIQYWMPLPEPPKDGEQNG